MAKQIPPPAPVPSDDRTALRALEATVSALRGDLAKFAEALSSQAIRGTRDEVLRAIQTDVAAEFNRLRPQLDAAALGRDPAADLAAIRSAVNDLRVGLEAGQKSLAEVNANLSATRIQTLVNDATEVAANRVYRDEFEARLEELSVAFADADERFGQLRSYVDQFGPGGLPVVAQERDELGRRVAKQDAELQALRATCAKQTAALDEYAAAAVRHSLQASVDPEALSARLREYEALDRDLADRQSLQAAKERLEGNLEQLEAELANWRQQAKVESQVRVDQADLERMREAVARAEFAKGHAERRRQQSAQGESQAKQEAHQARADAEAAKAAAATAESLARRVEALDDEFKGTKDELNYSRAVNSELAKSNRQLETRVEVLSGELTKVRFQVDLALERARASEAERVAATLEESRRKLDIWAGHEAEIRAAEHVADAARQRELLSSAKAELQKLTANFSLAKSAEMVANAENQGLRLELEQTKVAKTIAIEATIADCQNRLDREREALRTEADVLRRQTLAAAEVDLGLARAAALRFTEVANEERRRFELLRADSETLAAQKGQLQAEITALEDRLHDFRVKDIPDEERAGQLRKPYFASDTLAPIADHYRREEDFVLHLEAEVAKAGFHFHTRLLRAFHTSLKTADYAPLVVLAGISGTGKSELPRLYADLGGIPFLEIAVQPSWDSPHDILGFYNYTDGRFKAEPLARLLHQLGDNSDPLGKSPCIVLLDEMNLARVEYYFSEMLSKLEARRAVSRRDNAETRKRASVGIDLGPGRAEHLYLDPRLLFVGTMNNDESTMTLSDKVLDRASAITFPAPREMSLREQGSIDHAKNRLSWATWQSWQKRPTDDNLREKLNVINDIMDDLGRPFGHRLFRAIYAYLSNYPSTDATHADDAWADQLAMKVFPRLRGLECESREVKGQLDRLKAHIPEALHASFGQARDREFFAFAGARDLYRGRQ